MIFFLLRIISAMAVMLAIFTFIYIKEENVILVTPHLPKYLSFFTSSSKGTACKCSYGSWPEAEITAAFLNQSLSWLRNISTLQEVSLRHPNLPIEVLQDPIQSRCSLLPSIFRYRQGILMSKLFTRSNTRIVAFEEIMDILKKDILYIYT